MKYISRLFLGLATALLVSACGGGGGGGGTVNPTLPANAVTITNANAGQVADTAVGTLSTLASINAVEADTPPSTAQVIDIVTGKVFDRSRRTQSVVTGVTQTYSCTGGGSVTVTYSETATSESGTVSFSSCTEYSITINGSVTYSSTWNNSTYAYTDTANGSISYVYGSTTFSIAMNYSETGNEYSGDYSLNMSYSVSGIPGGGFLVTTTSNIVGNYYSGNVTAGQLMVQGAGGTRLRITVISNNYADVELDPGTGVFTYHSSINLYYYQ